MENQEDPAKDALSKGESQKDAMNRTDDQYQNDSTDNQAKSNQEATYGSSFQNEKNDPSKEENAFLDKQRDHKAPADDHSNTFGQTVNRGNGGFGDQEDPIANEGDGTADWPTFEDDLEDDKPGDR